MVRFFSVPTVYADSDTVAPPIAGKTYRNRLFSLSFTKNTFRQNKKWDKAYTALSHFNDFSSQVL